MIEHDTIDYALTFVDQPILKYANFMRFSQFFVKKYKFFVKNTTFSVQIQLFDNNTTIEIDKNLK